MTVSDLQRKKAPERHRSHRCFGSGALWCAAVLGILAAVACYSSYRRDCAELKAKALSIVGAEVSSDRRVLALNHWIHWHLPTAQNTQYFLFSKLRATPLQVLGGGGDCADKSRLLTAMLREIGIPATMALCFHPTTGRPSHTVVEARIGPHDFMLVDPAFNLHYPRPADDGYYGIAELRREPTLLQKRLDYVWEVEPRLQALHWYDPKVASFVGLSTFNWKKNALTQLLHDVLFLIVGPEVYSLPRPRVLEEPKIAVACAIVLLLLATLLARSAVRRYFANADSSTPTEPARTQPVCEVSATRRTACGPPEEPSPHQPAPKCCGVP